VIVSLVGFDIHFLTSFLRHGGTPQEIPSLPLPTQPKFRQVVIVADVQKNKTCSLWGSGIDSRINRGRRRLHRFRDLCGGYKSSTNTIPRVRKINPKLISRNLEEDEIFSGFGRFPCIIKDAKVTFCRCTQLIPSRLPPDSGHEVDIIHAHATAYCHSALLSRSLPCCGTEDACAGIRSPFS